MELLIESIRMDGGTQPRETLDFSVVDDYQDDMESGATFPPVDVFYDGENYWLADGFHRVRAALACGHTAIDANVHQGTIEDAKWFSYGVNKDHGFRRTNEDKRRAVISALKMRPGTTDREIARHVGVSDRMVNNHRKELSAKDSQMPATRTATRNGKTYQINTENIGRRVPAEVNVVTTEVPAEVHDDRSDERYLAAQQADDEFNGSLVFDESMQLLDHLRAVRDCPLTAAEVAEFLGEHEAAKPLVEAAHEFLDSIIRQTTAPR